MSCRERVIDLVIPYEGKKMVVFAFFTPDSLFSVNLQPTYPPSGKYTYEDGIKNAKISVFENNILLENLSHTNNGIYKSSKNNKPIIGNKYQIKISAIGYPDIETTEESIPEIAEVINLSFSELDRNYKELSLVLKNNVQTEEYYAVLTTAQKGNFTYSLQANNLASYNPEINPCYFDGIGLNGFTNQCSSNNQIDFKLGLKVLTISSSADITQSKPEKLVLNLRKINSSLYKYYSSQNEDDEGIQLAFLSPKPRFTNIKGGYGIFATYSQVDFDLKP